MNLCPWPNHYSPPQSVTPYNYLSRAAVTLGVSVSFIRQKNRQRSIGRTRFAIAYVMRTKLDYSFTRIASSLNIERTSAIHGFKRSQQLIAECPHFARMVKELEMVA